MPVSKQQVDKFVQLLENKKTKDALLYLDKINQEDPDPVAQEVVARGLERCLVDKKTTPMGMNSALYVYKQIFVRSLFDFIEIDAFNVKIHKFVYDTCLYNAASKLENRGEKYFEDVMKLELTQQNKMLGSTIVQFALELMQCMAQWYPQCLIQQKPSMYSQYYKKLKEKKVTFPTPQQYQIMKKTDQQKFKKNVDIWIDKVLREMQDEQREQEQKGKTPLPPDPQTLKPINTTPLKNNNSPQFIKYQNDQIMSKIDDSKSGAKRQIGQQKKPAVELKKQLQKDSNTRQSKMPSDNRNLVNEGKKQVSHQSNHEVNDTKLKQVPALKKNISEQGNFILTDPSQIAAVKNIPDNANFILSDPNQLKKMPSIDKKEQPQGISNVPKTMNETKKNINNSNAPTIVKESNEKSKLKIPEPKKEEQDPKVIEARIKMLVDQTLKNSVPDQPVPEGQFSQSYVIKYSKINGNNVQHSNKRVQRKMELPSPSAKKSISPHVHYGKQQVAKMNSGIKKSKEQNLRKSAVRQINTSSVINSRVSEGLAGLVGESKISKFHTPRKNSESDSMKTPIRKIQPDAQQQIKKDPKKQEKREVKKFYKTENKEFYQHAGVRQARHEPAKKRSLPKTERKYLNNVQPFTAAFGNQSPENLKREILNNKTLSDFRNLKNKKRSGNPNIQDYYLREPLLQKIQKLRTREQIIRYLPEYFEPLDTYMEALINESQKIRSNPINQPSRPFLRNQSLQLRLIKLAESYSLSIRNLKQKAINIGYSQALQAKFGDEFSCRIKVKGFERKRVDDVTVWRIQPLEIVDIPFDFSTEDPNFKFLQIILAIDQKINNFYLPITLLDQGVIEKYIDHEQINSFINNNGRVFKSTPICLSLRDDYQHFLDLPAFMSKNSNINSQIIGYMTYQIATNRKQKIKLNIFIKRCEKYSNFYEICSLVDNRSEESIDFSKVIIELLCFLLIKDR